MSFRLLKATRSQFLIAGGLYLLRKFRVPVAPWLKHVAVVLLILNWPNLPFGWHGRVFAPMFYMRWQQFKAWMGWHRCDTGSRAKELGLPKECWHLPAIGRSPFEVACVQTAKTGFAEGDFMLHQSNSVYAAKMDFSRSLYACMYFGPVTVRENVQLHVGGTSFVYFKEIPLFTDYTVETRLAAYDHRWLFALTLFTIPAPRSTGNPPKPVKGIVINTPQQGNRILCCIGLSKVTCKVGGRQGTVSPRRIFSGNGFGVDASNWLHIEALRKQGLRFKASKDWLLGVTDPEGSDGMEPFEEKNQRALAVIEKLGGGEKKEVWVELLSVLLED